ncbi:MAG TPA: hypothetical protein VG015_01005, partial [Candidatus Dormibacteraeota bacterium]|nr:hypothetical protein [Candidatus Dormibacteraeota bacterium]
VERGGITYMPLYHPAAALHNGSLVADLQRDFDGVRRYLDSRRPADIMPQGEPPSEPNPRPSEQLSLL